ncbi:MAG: PQQ-binding-like beta-propeller repeat protein [Planctomycetota bacterium]
MRQVFRSNERFIPRRLWLAILILWMTAPLSAQSADELQAIDELIGDYTPTYQATKTFDVAARSQTRQSFQQIRRHIRDRHWPLAAERLQEVLDRHPNHVIAIDPAEYRKYSAEGDALLLYRGAGELAHRVIGLMPQEGLEAYRRRFDESSREQLENAKKTRSLDELRRIVERYYWTRSGLPALVLLGNLYQEQGNHDAAAWFLLNAVAYPRAPEDEARLRSVAAARATLSLRLNDREESLAELRHLARNLEGVLSVEGDNITLLATIDQILEDTRPKRPFTGTNSVLADWPQITGSNAGSGLMAPPAAPTRSRWVKNLDFNPFQDEPRSNAFYNIEKYQLALPFYPSIADGAVLVNDSVSIQSHDLLSGELLWSYRSDLGRQIANDRSGLSELEGLGPNAIFGSTVRGGIVYTNLQVVSSARRSQTFHGMQIQITLPQRKLFAFDQASGKLLWSHAEPPFTRDPEIAPLSEPTPPVIFGDLAIASAWFEKGKFHAVVCAFDRFTGELVWRTPVATGQLELNMFGRPFLEYSPGMVAEAEGTIYFCTNLGVVAALDARSGWIQWLREYDPIEIYPPSGMNPEMRPTFWANSPPILWDDKLYFAPTDDTDLYCLDAKSGYTLWRQTYDSPSPRSSFRARQLRHHMAAVHAGKVFITGPNLTLRDAESGEIIRQLDLGDPMMTTRPAVTEDGVFVRKGDSLLRFDLRGELQEILALESTPNREGAILVSGGGALVSASRERVEAYLDKDIILAKKRQELQKLPAGSPERHLGFGDLEILRGDYDSAIGEFRNAIDALPKSARDEFDERYRVARTGLFRTYRELGRNARDSRKSAELFFEAEKYAPSEEMRIQTRLFAIEELAVRAQADPRRYESALQELLDEYGDRLEYLDGPAEEASRVGVRALRMRIAHRVRREDWTGAIRDAQQLISRYSGDSERGRPVSEYARDAIREALGQAPRDVRESYEDQARQSIAASRVADSPEQFQRTLEQYPLSRSAEEHYLDLAGLYIDRGDTTAALGVTREFVSKYPESPRRAEVYLYQAAVAEAEDNRPLARALAERVLSRHASQSTQQGALAGELARALLDRLGEDRGAAADSRPTSGGELVRAWHAELGPNVESDLVRPRGERPLSARGLLFAWVDNKYLTAIDLEKKEQLWQRSLNGLSIVQSHLEPIFVNRSLVASDTADVVAFDPRTNAEHWRRKFSGDVRSRTVHNGIVFVHTHLYGLVDESEVTAIDGVSGAVLWSSSYSSEVRSILPTDESLVVELQSGDRTRLAVVDAFTGIPDYERVVTGDVTRMRDAWTHGNRLYLPDRQEIACFDVSRQRDLWTRAFPNQRWQAFQKGEHPVVLVDVPLPSSARNQTRVLLLDPATGAIVKEKQFAFDGEHERQLSLDDVVVLKSGAIRDPRDRSLQTTFHGIEIPALQSNWSTQFTFSPDMTAEERPFYTSLQDIRTTSEHVYLCFNVTRPVPGSAIKSKVEVLDRKSGEVLQTFEMEDAPESQANIDLHGSRLFVLKGTTLICYEPKR